jgi:hypothetical protein
VWLQDSPPNVKMQLRNLTDAVYQHPEILLMQAEAGPGTMQLYLRAIDLVVVGTGLASQ